MSSPSEENSTCLDLLKIRWNSDSGADNVQCATLLEISERGGLIHTDYPISCGTILHIQVTDNRNVDAEVLDYEEDEFGAYLKIRVTEAWYPRLFRPAYTLGSIGEDSGNVAEPDGDCRPDQSNRLPLT